MVWCKQGKGIETENTRSWKREIYQYEGEKQEVETL